MNARSILILSLGLNLALGAWLVTKLRHPPEASWPAQPTETPKVPNAFPARRRPATNVLGTAGGRRNRTSSAMPASG